MMRNREKTVLMNKRWNVV